MYTLHAEIKCNVFAFLDDCIYEDDEEPTDLDYEADNLCKAFITLYILSEGIDDIKIKDGGKDGLKAYIKKLVYLKRHEPDTYRKLEEGEKVVVIQPTECKNSADVPTEPFR